MIKKKYVSLKYGILNIEFIFENICGWVKSIYMKGYCFLKIMGINDIIIL